MKAKKVYEFVQRKDIKAEIGASELLKRSIPEWFAKWAPKIDFEIKNDKIYIDHLDLYNVEELEYLLDNLIVNNSIRILLLGSFCICF